MWRVLHKVKYFLRFAFFRGCRNLWSLQPNFWVRKVWIDWICRINDLADKGLRDLAFRTSLLPSASCFMPAKFVGARSKGANSDFEQPREFVLWCGFARFRSQTSFREVKYCDVFFLQEFRMWYWERRFASEVYGYFTNRKRRILEIPREFRLVCAHRGLFIRFILSTVFLDIIVKQRKRNPLFLKVPAIEANRFSSIDIISTYLWA